MAHSYLSVDRDQQFLLPPDMRDWLPAGHLVWFVLEVVERVDTSVLHARHPNDGVGRRAHDPDMMLGLLLYAYCHGVRSSREIERLCSTDVAFRVLTAGRAPDHSTIARFRQGHGEIAAGLFVDVLVLCHEAGLAKVGLIAVDGTKIAANAALKANRSRAKIEAEVAAMFVDADRVDGAEDAEFGDRRGDELPDELVDPRKRKRRLDAALAALAEAERAAEADRPPGWVSAAVQVQVARDRAAAAEAAQVERDRDRAEREAAAAAEGRLLRGRRPLGPHRDVRRARDRLAKAEAKAAAAAEDDRDLQINVTDPDSRIMKTAKGWTQGYNAQGACNTAGVIVAAEVTQDATDFRQCVPMMTLTQANLDAAGIDQPIDVMLFDAGYCSDANLTAAGPDRLIATTKAWKLRKLAPPDGPPPDNASALEKMTHRLRTPEGKTLYRFRQHTIEPVFGNIKHGLGFRHFSQRGLAAADAEWKLQTAVHNILKLFRHHQPHPA